VTSGASGTAGADGWTPPGGLDAPHGALLRALEGRTTITRADFDGEATTRRLLPDGALDRLNEAAFDVCDAPLLDGDDPLDIDPDVLEELLQP
jgi:hypothetical protein